MQADQAFRLLLAPGAEALVFLGRRNEIARAFREFPGPAFAYGTNAGKAHALVPVGKVPEVLTRGLARHEPLRDAPAEATLRSG